MKKYRVVYIGNPEFANGPLEALINEESIEVPLVITQPDKRRSRGKLLPAPVKAFALEHGLNTYGTSDINSEESIAKIESVNPDFIVVVAFGQFLNATFLKAFKDRVLNVHASILPKYRGASPINHSLLNGDEETGVSIMLIDTGMDAGDVLKICTLKIQDDHNYLNLSDDLSLLGGKCLVATLLDFEQYYENRTAQNHDEATFTGFITREMGKIDFRESSTQIKNKSRAFYSWPGLFFNYEDNVVKLHEFDFVPKFNDDEPGRIIKANNEGVYVNCMDSCMVMKEIQFPGKKRTTVDAFLKGNEIKNIMLE